MFEIGRILDGKVTGLTNFGAFIGLPENKTGMVHISEISLSYVKDIHDFLKEGQNVRVKVIDVSDEGKISLSIKQVSDGDGQNAQNEASAEKSQSFARQQSSANVWKGMPEKKSDAPLSFEDMIAQFKKKSDEKLADKRKSADSKRGSYSKRR